jgi:hypothetical protein
MSNRSLLSLLVLLFSTLPELALAQWRAVGASARCEGKSDLSSAVLHLDTRSKKEAGFLRFGPLTQAGDPRYMNVSWRAEGQMQGRDAMRVSVVYSATDQFPEKPEHLLGRADSLHRGKVSGEHFFNPSVPRIGAGKPGVKSIWLEISTSLVARDGKIMAPARGHLTLRQVEVLGSHLPASASSIERRTRYLLHAGRRARGEAPQRGANKDALRLPGLLASLLEARDPLDPRVGVFFEQSQQIFAKLQAPGNRLGPFEIYLPIATYTGATRLTHIDVKKHPGFAAYRAAVLKHQSLWPDYRSNGVAPTPRPLPATRSPQDVTERIDNGNFRLLVTAAGFLAAQEFPELKTTWQVRDAAPIVYTNADIRREMNHYLRRVYHSIVTRNTNESGATIYMALDFAAIRSVANYAKDPVIKKVATETLDFLYASLASSYNQGAYVNSSARSKGDFLGTEGATGFVGWLEFPGNKGIRAATTQFNVFNALPGDYRVPTWVKPLAAFPTVKRETIGPARNYSWHSRHYSLVNGIEHTGNKLTDKRWDRHGFYKEYSRHKLNWFGPTSGAFSPQWENSAQPYGGRRNQRNGAFYGTNPWSLVQQHRGTQIGLSCVSESYPFRKLYISWGGGVRASISDPSGWKVNHTGAMIFAFRALKKPTAQGLSGWVGGHYDEYDYRKTAWLLETVEAPARENRSTADMQREMAQILAKLKAAEVVVEHLDDATPTPPKLRYRSPIHGGTLTLDASVFPIAADGEGIAISDYPILATSPVSAQGPRLLVHQGRMQVFDANGRELLRRTYEDWLKP